MESIDFPNGVSYSLVPEEQTTEMYGLVVPASIKDTLVVTGTHCCGKSTLEARVRGIEFDEFDVSENTTFITFSRAPRFQNYWLLSQDRRFRSLPGQVLAVNLCYDFHVTNPTGFGSLFVSVANKEVYLHRRYERFDFNGIPVPLHIRRGVSFEMRIFNPSRIQELTRERADKECEKINAGEKISEHLDILPLLSEEDVRAGQFLLMQTAEFLESKGCDVYVRTSFEGYPMRLG